MAHPPLAAYQRLSWLVEADAGLEPVELCSGDVRRIGYHGVERCSLDRVKELAQAQLQRRVGVDASGVVCRHCKSPFRHIRSYDSGKRPFERQAECNATAAGSDIHHRSPTSLRLRPVENPLD